jgi:hypothetical protein
MVKMTIAGQDLGSFAGLGSVVSAVIDEHSAL